MAMLYMSVFVLVPLAAVVAKAVSSGLGTFWDSIDNTLAIRFATASPASGSSTR